MWKLVFLCAHYESLRQEFDLTTLMQLPPRSQFEFGSGVAFGILKLMDNRRFRADQLLKWLTLLRDSGLTIPKADGIEIRSILKTNLQLHNEDIVHNLLDWVSPNVALRPPLDLPEQAP